LARAGEKETIGEEILAIVECNNCFTDGVQVATVAPLEITALSTLIPGKTL